MDKSSIVQGSSFTEPLWRTIGLVLGDVANVSVCQQDGNNILEKVHFLSVNATPVDASTCLPGDGIFPNPLYISLRIGEEVSTGETLSIVLVTGSCQNPGILSDPVMITGKSIVSFYDVYIMFVYYSFILCVGGWMDLCVKN